MANPALRTYGSLPRNYFRGPLARIWISPSATTALRREKLALEARAEFFNALNHTQFANPITNINDYFSAKLPKQPIRGSSS